LELYKLLLSWIDLVEGYIETKEFEDIASDFSRQTLIEALIFIATHGDISSKTVKPLKEVIKLIEDDFE